MREKEPRVNEKITYFVNYTKKERKEKLSERPRCIHKIISTSSTCSKKDLIIKFNQKIQLKVDSVP